MSYFIICTECSGENIAVAAVSYLPHPPHTHTHTNDYGFDNTNQMDLSSIKDDRSAMRMLYNEIKGMKAMSHPNIVRLQEV